MSAAAVPTFDNSPMPFTPAGLTSSSTFIGSNAITPKSRQALNLTMTCTSTPGWKYGTLEVYHNDPNIPNPVSLNVPLLCSGALLTGYYGMDYPDNGGTIDLLGVNGSTAEDTYYIRNFENYGIGSASDPAILKVQFTTSAPWLSVSPSLEELSPGEYSSQIHTISASCADRILGLRTGTVTLTTNTGKIVTWTVNLTCRAASISVVQDTLPTLDVGLNTSVSRQVNIQNTGSWYLEISNITSDQPWLSVSPTTFTFADNFPIIPVSFGYPDGRDIMVTTACGAVSETRTGTLKIFHDAWNVPSPLLVPVTIRCQ